MLKIILVGLLLVHTLLGAERWPDNFTVDAHGVSWMDKDGSARFHENPGALVVEGTAPFNGKVVCEKRADATCAKELYKSCVGVSCPIYEEFAAQSVCFKVECAFVPRNEKFSISHGEFGGPVHARLSCWDALFDAGQITLTLHPIGRGY